MAAVDEWLLSTSLFCEVMSRRLWRTFVHARIACVGHGDSCSFAAGNAWSWWPYLMAASEGATLLCRTYLLRMRHQRVQRRLRIAPAFSGASVVRHGLGCWHLGCGRVSRWRKRYERRPGPLRKQPPGYVAASFCGGLLPPAGTECPNTALLRRRSAVGKRPAVAAASARARSRLGGSPFPPLLFSPSFPSPSGFLACPSRPFSSPHPLFQR